MSEKSHTHPIDQLIRTPSDELVTRLSSERHSTMVRRMRLLLPLAALCIIGIVMAFSGREAPLAPVPREHILPKTTSRNELINPKFQSQDSRSQSYTITADRATQDTKDMNTIQLEKPVADMEMNNGNWIAVTSQNGTYNQGTGQLQLNGNVEIRHDSGYELHGHTMLIDVSKKQLISQTPVSGHGPAADISASGVNAEGHDKRIVFTGPAKLTLRINKENQQRQPITQNATSNDKIGESP